MVFRNLNRKEVDDLVRDIYNLRAGNYRKVGDEKAFLTDGFKIYKKHLSEICLSFSHKIDVLDLGCGTGRYFCCLRNVKTLVGIDISENMIEEAKESLDKSKLDIESTELFVHNAHDIEQLLIGRAFDFIYSIGVFAEYTVLSSELLNKVYDLLNPGGKIYITTVNKNVSFNKSLSFKKIIKHIIGDNYFIKRNRFDFSKFYLTLGKLKKILNESKFLSYKIESFKDSKHLHNIIIAQKG